MDAKARLKSIDLIDKKQSQIDSAFRILVDALCKCATWPGSNMAADTDTTKWNVAMTGIEDALSMLENDIYE